MNILVISDIHNDIENMMNYIDKLALLNFDVIVVPGDFSDQNVPKGIDKADIGIVILEELNSLGKPILAVPGNLDKELIPILEERNISLHGTGKIIKNIGFYGIGGAATPFQTPLEPTEDELKKGLEIGYDLVKKCEKKVQVTHMPPARTKLDIIASGAHVGSEVIRVFIEKNQPDAAISAHIHEARGVDELEKTKLVNAGRFPEGYCGLITIEKEKTTAKIINLI